MITNKPKNHEKGWLHKHLPLASVTGREKGKAAMDRASIMKRWRHQPPEESKTIPTMKTFKVEKENKDAAN